MPTPSSRPIHPVPRRRLASRHVASRPSRLCVDVALLRGVATATLRRCYGLAANETAHCGRNDGHHISRERRASLSTLKGKNGDLDMSAQVDRLINEAQDHTNLCQLYWGWNPFC